MLSFQKFLVVLFAVLIYSAALLLFPTALRWLSYKHRELTIFIIESTIFGLFIIPLFNLVPELVEAIFEVQSSLICVGPGVLTLIVTQRRRSARLRSDKAEIEGDEFAFWACKMMI